MKLSFFSCKEVEIWSDFLNISLAIYILFREMVVPVFLGQRGTALLRSEIVANGRKRSQIVASNVIPVLPFF